MKYTQNQKIMQITEDSLIIGIDIAKDVHFARDIDYRGIEYGRTLSFKNEREGFEKLEHWINKIKERNDKATAIIGMEPTGPYWFCLFSYLIEQDYECVTVNPFHVKQFKEISDNTPTKNDKKDSKIIANLVKNGHYFKPNILEGDYEDLRMASQQRSQCKIEKTRIANKIENWLTRYFPEYKEILKNVGNKGSIYILENYPLPSELSKLDPEKLFRELPKNLRIGLGRERLKKLIEVSKKSIGLSTGKDLAKLEIKYLIIQYNVQEMKLKELEKQLERISNNLPETKKLMQIKGIGLNLSTGIIGELGDVRNYKDPRQLYKMAGLNLKENSSGKKKGKIGITKRGRSELRKYLFQAIFGMIRNNPAFKEQYYYYRERKINPLQGIETIIALCRKLLRIIHAIIINDVDYDEEKMLRDIKRPKETSLQAA